MSVVPTPLGFGGGIDQSTMPARARPETFYDLLNFRHNNNQFGKLEQTPWWRTTSSVTPATYWNGAAGVTESAASVVTMSTDQFRMTSFAYDGVQVFQQSVQPTAENVNTGCRIVINSVAGLALPLGTTLDIVIDGAATFKWRKNGGGYTALVPITTAGVSIDGGNVTVYFLTTTGFSIADTWSWLRTDCSFDSAVSPRITGPTAFTFYKNVLYCVNRNTRICRITADSSNVQYVITVGYRAVYGTCLTFFDDHLVLGGFSKTNVSYYETNRVKTVGWSDKTDIDNFIPTDTNEADQYTLPSLAQTDTVPDYTPLSRIKAVAVVAQRLFVFTTKEMYVTSALGLPDVFSFSLFTRLSIAVEYQPVINAPNGVYICVFGDVLFFDGGSFQSLGVPIANVNSNFNGVFGKWNQYTRELILIVGNTMLVWQQRWGSWYRRAVGFSADNPVVGCVDFSDTDQVSLGLPNLKIVGESQSEINQPVKDATSGTVYATPKITTQMVNGGRFGAVKEAAGTYLTLQSFSTGVSSTYYSTAANLQVNLYWYTDDTGVISGSPSTVTGSSWVSSNADGIVSYPRLKFRALAIELQLTGLTANKPPYRALVSGIELLTINSETRRVER